MKVTSRSYQIKAVIFDFDGTLTAPGALDFAGLKQRMGCPADTPVWEHIQGLTDPDARHQARAQLNAFEMQGAAGSRPNIDAQETIRWIKAHHLLTGILTRNSRQAVSVGLSRFPRLTENDFDLIISREDGPALKPSGDGIRLAADRWGISAPEILMVGDYLFDIQAGVDADALTVLLDPDDHPELAGVQCDFRIHRLTELQSIILDGLALEAGKLPNETLQTYLKAFDIQDPSLIVSAGVGEDTAAVDVTGDEVLVLKSDPITFATDAIGQYAVIVNANDIVTAGAKPRWLLTTLLLPCGTTPSHIRAIMQELALVCNQWGITLCGGHTEISDAVRRPVVVGMMAGTVNRSELIEKRNMQSGDLVLLTKAAAVEGTAIIARQFGRRLTAKGLTVTEIDQGKDFLRQISIVPEARLAARNRLATAMHDVTEGGLATALEELSTAGEHKIAVQMDAVPVHPLTRKICDTMGLDPLGLIGSGGHISEPTR